MSVYVYIAPLVCTNTEVVAYTGRCDELPKFGARVRITMSVGYYVICICSVRKSKLVVRMIR